VTRALVTPLTGVGACVAVFGDVDEAVRIEDHVFDSLEGTIFVTGLCNVSKTRLV
jgi:hypothetical protein